MEILADPEIVSTPGSELVASPPSKVYHVHSKDDHETPDLFYDTVQKEFGGFDLDVCASQQNSKCALYYDQGDDGLSQEWFGKVWMNPPYSQVGAWVKKMALEFLKGHIDLGVALVASRTDTEWFFHAGNHCTEIRFLKGRLTFKGSKDTAPFPSALLIFQGLPTVYNQLKFEQRVVFWDWKAGKAIVPLIGGPPSAKKGLASLIEKSQEKKFFYGPSSTKEGVVGTAMKVGAMLPAPVFSGFKPPEEFGYSLAKQDKVAKSLAAQLEEQSQKSPMPKKTFEEQVQLLLASGKTVL